MAYDRQSSMHYAHKLTTSGYVSGEVKLAITLCLLASGDAYDLAVIFDISPRWCQYIMLDVLKNLILEINLGKIDIATYLSDDDAIQKVNNGFSVRSDGILKGVIGAIAGWLVRIHRPSL